MIVVGSFFAHKGCTLVEELLNDVLHKMADEMLQCHLTAQHQRVFGPSMGLSMWCCVCGKKKTVWLGSGCNFSSLCATEEIGGTAFITIVMMSMKVGLVWMA